MRWTLPAGRLSGMSDNGPSSSTDLRSVRDRRCIARRSAVGCLTLVAAAVACIGYLHLAVGLSPVRTMVSDYVFTVVGVVLLPAGMLAMAGALVLLGAGLARAGLAGRGVSALIGTAGLGLVLMACFRADATGALPSVPGAIHKVAGCLLFVAIPVVGWLLSYGDGRRAARLPVRALRPLAGCAALCFAVFLVSYLPAAGVSVPDGAALVRVQGLLERGALVSDVALVVLIAGRLAVPVTTGALPWAAARVGPRRSRTDPSRSAAW